MKKVLLLVNTGTPDKPDVRNVRRFLSEFLNDPRVIDLPWLFRKLLVNLIIVPFRAGKSTKLYRELWTPEGSPLLLHLANLITRLRDLLKDNYLVYGAMRYGNPALKDILLKIKNESPDELVVLPLFPQYASSTTGSVNAFIMKEIQTWNVMPSISFIGQFYSHPAYIEALTNQIKRYDPGSFDHVLFSYHGLPLRHISKAHPEHSISECTCLKSMPQHGNLCYKATCYATTRLLVEKLALPDKGYSTSFQSRLSKDWLSPFTDMTLKNLIAEGKRRVLVVAPSFVADCLETIVEIESEYRNIFLNEGGEELVLVKSMNDSEEWSDAIIKITDTDY